MQKYKLDDIIKEFIIDSGETSMNKYSRFYQLAVSCLRELNMDLSGCPKIKELHINDNCTVDLPNDYMQYTRIAICGSDGQLHSLGLNNSLCINPKYDDCGNENFTHGGNPTTSSTQYPIYSNNFYYANHFRNGELMGRFFGIGGGNNANGEFRIDKDNNRILLSSINSNVSHIVLEYISDINDIDEDFEVHPFLVETIKSWIYWKYIQRNLRVSLGEKQLAEQDYKLNYNKAKNRFSAFTVDEFLAAIRSGNFSTPKF